MIVRANLLLVMTIIWAGSTAAGTESSLVVLKDTGRERDGLPVVEPHPEAAKWEAVLCSGYSGKLLRLYALEQEYLRRKTGTCVEPAYLVLSQRQGGFPRFGFYLNDVKKADAGWVDLHESSAVSGRFGAMDQIFPHELLHVMLHQLIGEFPMSGANQVHAVGVRTDPVIAFDEGFAEHAQILAVDDPQAAADTKALIENGALEHRARADVHRYVNDLSHWYMPCKPSQMRFLIWFSRSEQVLRYHAVKANEFARESPVPDSLWSRSDKYGAYLVQCVAPGDADATPKSASVMLSTEGVVAHLFWTWVTDSALQERKCSDDFYAAFGVRSEDVSPLENAYLKLFTVLAEKRPHTTAEVVPAYREFFPEEQPDVDKLVRAALLGQDLPATQPEIWLANSTFTTGTSLFDQFRGMPRTHTFDVNAASRLDWLSVPGMTAEQAEQLMAQAPFASIDDVGSRLKWSESQRQQLADMAAEMDRLRAASGEDESLQISQLLLPYVWRLLALVACATVCGAWLALKIGVQRWWTAALIACVASLLVVALAWIINCPTWFPFLVPAALGGVPWGLWRAAFRRKTWYVLQPLCVWFAASIPALLFARAGW